MPPHRLLQVGVGAALLLATAGCRQPSPGVTVVTHGHSVHVRASNYCFHGRTFTHQDDCPADGPRVTQVEVRPGDTVGIDVDRELARTGWVIYDPVTRENGTIHKGRYVSFPVDLGNATSAFLEVHQVTGSGTSTADLVRVLGIWRFELVESSS
jgi:hypothetical protein